MLSYFDDEENMEVWFCANESCSEYDGVDSNPKRLTPFNLQ